MMSEELAAQTGRLVLMEQKKPKRGFFIIF